VFTGQSVPVGGWWISARDLLEETRSTGSSPTTPGSTDQAVYVVHRRRVAIHPVPTATASMHVPSPTSWWRASTAN